MITDKNLLVSNNQSLATGTQLVVSTDSVDLSTLRDVGEGRTVNLVASITEAPITACTLQNSGDTVTAVAHGLANGTIVKFVTLSGSIGPTVGTTYYVISTATDTFQVSTSAGGSAEVITADGTGTFTSVQGMTVQVITASDSALTTAIQVIGASDEIPFAALIPATGQKQGFTWSLKLNPLISGITAATASQGNLGARYIGARYVANGEFTSGKVTAQFVLDTQDGRKAYTSGFTVV